MHNINLNDRVLTIMHCNSNFHSVQTSTIVLYIDHRKCKQIYESFDESFDESLYFIRINFIHNV